MFQWLMLWENTHRMITLMTAMILQNISKKWKIVSLLANYSGT